MTAFHTLDRYDFFRKTALVRLDLDVPVSAAGVVQDDTRLQAGLATLTYITKAGGRAVVVGHRGRPGGQPNSETSLRPVADVLGDLLKKEVTFVPDCVGRVVEQAVAEVPFGEVIMLENTRFHTEEEKNDPVFARHMASVADVFVYDAFAVSHREHASTVGLMAHLPHYMGLHMQAEIAQLDAALHNPKKPLLAIVGGAKISTKIDILKNIITKADMLMLGGAMANTFLEAKDMPMGRSLLEPDFIETARDILAEAGILGCRILLPQDVVVAKKLEVGITSAVKAPDNLASEDVALDIGPKTLVTWQNVIKKAGTVIWAGPLGAFEVEPFNAGSFAIAEALADADGVTLAGGGDTLSCLNKSGFADKLDAVSTAGGAFLDYLGGKPLPVVEALRRAV